MFVIRCGTERELRNELALKLNAWFGKTGMRKFLAKNSEIRNNPIQMHFFSAKKIKKNIRVIYLRFLLFLTELR